MVAAVVPGLVVLAGTMWGITAMIDADSLPPNNWIGIRTRATKRSRESWDAAHRAAAPWLRRSAWVGGGAAVPLLACLLGGTAGWVMPTVIALAAIGYAGCLGLVTYGSVLAQRAALAARP